MRNTSVARSGEADNGHADNLSGQRTPGERCQALRKRSKAARNLTSIVEDEGRVSGPAGFGALLRQHRLAAGLSQEDLAERARMSREGVSALERGHRRTPQRETLALLAGALALSESQRRAFEAAARSEPRPRYGSSVAVGPWLGAEATALPLALTSFVGREAALDDLAALVRQHRLVTVTGPGGVGKTQMALHVGTTLSEATDRAVCFITLAPIVDPSLVVTAIASALGLQEVPNHPIRETLVAYLKNKAMLLILDNCEHVLVEVRPVVDAVLRHCAGIAILATSRESLRVAGEHTYRLPSLSVPSPEAVHRVNARNGRTYAAMALFADRAQAVDHRFSLTDENAPIVAEICRRLDGIPLAIELAAARTNVLSVRALAQGLNDRFRILTGDEYNALPRRQTMRAAIDWSYELLSAREQRVFERLAVFPGGCTLASAKVVCNGEVVPEDDMLGVLSSLVDKSLVVADLEGAWPRYRLLESFREYAREKLAMRGDLHAALGRHACVCLELGEQLERAFDVGPDEVWCALVREELANWRAALRWALTERGDVFLGQQLVGQLSLVWKYFTRVEGRRWIALALDLVDDQTPQRVLASLKYGEATVAWQLREYKGALASCETAIAHYRAVSDPLGVARAQDIASVALFSLGRVAESQALEQEVFKVARSAGIQRLTAYAMSWLACLGNVTEARSYMADALQIFDSMGANLDAASALNALADIELRAGNTELALRHATCALARFSDFDDLSASMDCRSDMARLFITLAQYGEAEKYARETLEFARERQEDVYVAFALHHLGAIAALRGLAAGERTDVSSRAARILGFSDAGIKAMGSGRQPTDQLVYDRAMSAVRDAIGADTLSTLMAEGVAMTEEQAVEAALAL